MNTRGQQLRLVEALLFASAEPLTEDQILRRLPEGTELESLMAELEAFYAERGVQLVRVGARWAFRTAADVAPLMRIETAVSRKPSRAAVETLAIIAYHQPVTRGEIEEVRGVALSRGTLDTLLEAGWVKPKGRRRTPGRPVTWGTTEAFLDHFGLSSLDSLPGVAELKAAGLLDTRPAISALESRGQLFDPAEPEPVTEIPLAADFGEDLLPREVETGAEDDPNPDPGAERTPDKSSPVMARHRTP